jgi:hypothetical protein
MNMYKKMYGSRNLKEYLITTAFAGHCQGTQLSAFMWIHVGET